MAPLIELYKADHRMLIEWICRTYGIVTEQNLAGTLQAPVSNAAFAKTNIAHMNPHRLRRENIARRLRLYRDEGLVDIFQMIDQMYSTAEYQAEIKKYAKVGMEENVTRRIIDEVASLYDEPAKRKLKNDAEQERFRDEERRLHFHELLQENQRLLTLCNETLIWQFDGIDNQKKLRIVTSDAFDAIPHPIDPLVEAGILIDRAPVTILQGDARKQLPHWELWDDTYRYLINAYGWLVDEQGKMVDKPIEHGLGRIPGVLLHRREPTTKILDADHGTDIVSAHLSVTWLNMMVMRLAKVQGENQPVLQGNLAQLAQGQVMNGEKPLMLPPETKATMLGMVTDPEHYIKAKRDVISSVCRTYGMSYEQYSISESARETSGKAYEVRRVKLTEIRAEARRRALVNERLVIDLMGFDTDGMRVDHREQALPQDAIEEVALLSDKMRMGLDSPVTFLQRKDPDLHREDAIKQIQDNLADYAMLIVMVRALNMPSGADAANPGLNPQGNGKLNVKNRGVMDNTGFGAPIVGPQITLRTKSDRASQSIQSGLSAENPLDGYTSMDRSTPAAGPNGRQ